MIAALLANWKAVVEVVAALALAAVVAWFPRHEREIGRQQQVAVQAQLAAAQVVKNQEVQDRAKELTDQAVAQYKATLAAGPSSSAPHVRVCVPAASSAVVPAAAGAGPVDHGTAAGPAVVAQPGADIGPATDKRFADEDAQIEALQSYVRACQDAGICRRQ